MPKTFPRNELPDELFNSIMHELRRSDEYNDGMSFQQIADWVTSQLPEGTVFTRAQVWAMKRDFLRGRVKHYFYPDIKDKKNNEVLIPKFSIKKSARLYGNGASPVLIINDVHLPLTDFELATKAIQHAEEEGCKVCVIGGDLFNMGATSKWRKLAPTVSLVDELRLSRYFLKMLTDVFDKIYVIAGNHDRWYWNVEERFDFESLVSLVTDEVETGKVVVSPYSEIKIIFHGNTWLVVHQKEARKNYWSIADQIAQKYQTNVIITHVHKNLLARDSYDRYTVASIGGLHNPELQEYIGLMTTTQQTQQQGYGILYPEGRLKIYAKGF